MIFLFFRYFYDDERPCIDIEVTSEKYKHPKVEWQCFGMWEMNDIHIPFKKKYGKKKND